METRASTLVVDGMRMHWVECGSGSDAVPVVLLHGLHDSHLTWKHIAPLLASDRRVLMPDLLGCGLSERPDASYQLSWHTHAVARWLQELGLTQMDVVGHSFGGGVAQMLLLEPSVKIRRLGLVASGGLGPHVGFWLRLATIPGVVEHFGQPFMAAGTRVALRHACSAMASDEIRRLGQMNAGEGSARAFARTVCDVINWRGQRRNFMHHAHQLGTLPAVTLFWGDCDAITPVADAVAFARAVDGVGFEHFLGCGHYLHHERADHFTARLRDFLDAPHLPTVRIGGQRQAARVPVWELRWSTLLHAAMASANQPRQLRAA